MKPILTDNLRNQYILFYILFIITTYFYFLGNLFGRYRKFGDWFWMG